MGTSDKATGDNATTGTPNLAAAERAEIEAAIDRGAEGLDEAVAEDEVRRERERVDRMPKVKGITIDEPWSTDLDDALWAVPAEEGTLVYVTIASASRAVVKDSELDKLARERIVTRYYATSHSSMLPRGVEQSLSLLPGVKRIGVTIEFLYTPGGKLLRSRIYESRFRSVGRTSHAEVPGILDSPGHVLHEPLARLMELSSRLLAERRKAGALVLYDLTHGWIATEEGHVRRLERSAEVAGHIIVQELMIAANAAVAAYAQENGIPILFRNHQAVGNPERGPLIELLEQATTSGAAVSWLDEFRRQIGNKMHRAEYGPMSRGHFGLNLPHYCHFTSPIRRYADLVCHRQILARLRGQHDPYGTDAARYIADHINSTLALERDAASERHKEQATEKAQRVLDAGEARRLESLGDKDFERVAKVVVRSGEECPEAFFGAAVARLQLRRLPMLVKTLILLDATSQGPRWTQLRQAVVADLGEHIEEAPSILSVAKDVIAGWTEPRASDQREGPPHATVFTVTIGSGDHLVADTGSSLREAERRAAVALLASLAGVERPSFPLPAAWRDSSEEAPASPEAGPSAPLADEGRDPISVLYEHAQAGRRRMPVYTFTTSGPPHTPNVVCACVYERRTTTGKATRKQDAKRLAAIAMLKMLGPTAAGR